MLSCNSQENVLETDTKALRFCSKYRYFRKYHLYVILGSITTVSFHLHSFPVKTNNTDNRVFLLGAGFSFNKSKISSCLSNISISSFFGSNFLLMLANIETYVFRDESVKFGRFSLRVFLIISLKYSIFYFI